MVLDIFGEALVEIDSIGGLTYHWQNLPKASGPAYLLLAGLSYVAGLQPPNKVTPL